MCRRTEGQFLLYRICIVYLNHMPGSVGCKANKPPASDAEIQLIRSRLVLGKTVDDLDLDIAVSKNTFPISVRAGIA